MIDVFPLSKLKDCAEISLLNSSFYCKLENFANNVPKCVSHAVFPLSDVSVRKPFFVITVAYTKKANKKLFGKDIYK